MRPMTKMCLVCAAAAVCSAPAQIRAEGYISPWIGLNVASPIDDGHTAFGVTTGYMGGGIFGFEADVGYTPDVFGSHAPLRADSAITVMGNAIVGVPIGGTHGAGVRPFVSAGLGVVRTRSEEGTIGDVTRSTNGFDYNIGVGMMGFFSDHFGMRGDVRYLGVLEDTNRGAGVDLDATRLRHWRVSAGVTFR
jgi:hypothetical protein